MMPTLTHSDRTDTQPADVAREVQQASGREATATDAGEVEVPLRDGETRITGYARDVLEREGFALNDVRDRLGQELAVYAR